MKSVPQHKSSLQDSAQRKGTGTVRKFTLLCCALFFLGQLLFLVSSKGKNDSADFYLQATAPALLSIVEKPADVLNVNASLTPFFFEPVPVNFCDKTLLLSVSGVGPMLADNIISTRANIGFYKNKNDLLLVSGIGESRMDRFAESFSFEITR